MGQPASRHGNAWCVPPPRRLPSYVVALSLLFVLSGWSVAVHAQTLTWVLDPEAPTETRERIEGQTSDLPYTRLAAADRRGPATIGDPLARAARLAPDGGARVIVWTAEGEGAITVTIVDLEGRRVLVREVGIAGEGDRSAALETVGLIVRSALEALADGGEIGVATVPMAAAGATPDPTPASEPEAATELPDETVEAPPRESEWMLGAGATMLGVVRDAPAFGGSGRLAWRYGRSWVGVAVQATGRQAVRTTEAAIDVAYVGAALEAGVVAVERGSFALVPLAALDLGRVRRETTRVADGFAGTGSRAHLDVRVGVGVLGRLRLADVAWLTLHVRLDVPLLAVRYSVINAGETVALGRTPRLGAALGLSVLARVGRRR